AALSLARVPLSAAALGPLSQHRRDRSGLHRRRARFGSVHGKSARGTGFGGRGARGYDADLGPDDRAGVRRGAVATEALALDSLARAHPGRSLPVLPLLRLALRRLLRVLHASRRETGAVRPVRFPAGPLREGPVSPGRVSHPDGARVRRGCLAPEAIPGDLLV